MAITPVSSTNLSGLDYPRHHDAALHGAGRIGGLQSQNRPPDTFEEVAGVEDQIAVAGEPSGIVDAVTSVEQYQVTVGQYLGPEITGGQRGIAHLEELKVRVVMADYGSGLAELKVSGFSRNLCPDWIGIVSDSTGTRIQANLTVRLKVCAARHIWRLLRPS